MRNLAVTVPKTQQAMVTTLVRQIFVQPDAESASKAWRRVADEIRWASIIATTVLAYIPQKQAKALRIEGFDPSRKGVSCQTISTFI